MNSKNILIFIVLICFLACTSEEEKTTQEFVRHVHNLNIDEIKNMSTEDTRPYIKMAIESIMSLGNKESKKQLEQVASTLECSGEGKRRKCTYFDDNEIKHFFELEFVAGFDEEGEEKLFIHIDNKYFLGE